MATKEENVSRVEAMARKRMIDRGLVGPDLHEWTEDVLEPVEPDFVEVVEEDPPHTPQTEDD